MGLVLCLMDGGPESTEVGRRGESPFVIGLQISVFQQRGLKVEIYLR